MVDLKTVIYIVLGVLTVGGSVVAFFQMQTKQNMEIKTLKERVSEVERKQALQTGYQIETEKSIVRIETKLDQILEVIKKGV